jgi:hypothetical protein
VILEPTAAASPGRRRFCPGLPSQGHGRTHGGPAPSALVRSATRLDRAPVLRTERQQLGELLVRDDRGRQSRFLIHDRDTKLSRAFDGVFRAF